MHHDSAYANSVAIIQSSGTGKSWMVHEQANLVFMIPFNLRWPVENNSEVDFIFFYFFFAKEGNLLYRHSVI